MELWLAVVLFLLSVAGIVLVQKYLRDKRTLRIVCLALLSVLALAFAVYIGLTLLLVHAVQQQPPAA